MLVTNRLKLLSSLSVLAILNGCSGYYQGADDIDIDPSYGPTQITQCNIITGISYEDMTSSLAAFANQKQTKFVDWLYIGLFRSNLQIDEPYVIIENRFSSEARPPFHILTFHEIGGDPKAEALRHEFYDRMEPLEGWEACPQDKSHNLPKRTGWRLSDKHQVTE